MKLTGALAPRLAGAIDFLIPETRPWYIKRPDVQIIMLTGNVIMIALVAGDTPISQIADIGIINSAHDVGGHDRGSLNQTFPFPEDSVMEG